MTNANNKNDAALIPGKAALQAVDLINSQNTVPLATSTGESAWTPAVYDVYEHRLYLLKPAQGLAKGRGEFRVVDMVGRSAEAGCFFGVRYEDIGEKLRPGRIVQRTLPAVECGEAFQRHPDRNGSPGLIA